MTQVRYALLRCERLEEEKMIKRLGKEPCIHENCQLDHAELGEYTEVGIYNVLENVKLDDFSYTDRFCTLQNVEVGKFSNIAAEVRIGPTSHPMDRPTMHHFFPP